MAYQDGYVRLHQTQVICGNINKLQYRIGSSGDEHYLLGWYSTFLVLIQYWLSESISAWSDCKIDLLHQISCRADITLCSAFKNVNLIWWRIIWQKSLYWVSQKKVGSRLSIFQEWYITRSNVIFLDIIHTLFVLSCVEFKRNKSYELEKNDG